MPNDAAHVRRAEIEARVAAATPGPWRSGWEDPVPVDKLNVDEAHVVYSLAPELTNDWWERGVILGTWYDGPITGCTRENADFIAHAREDIPWLLAEINRLTAERDAALTGAQAMSTPGTESDEHS